MSITLLPGASKTLFERVIKFFKDDDWNFATEEEQKYLQMAFKGKNGQWRCVARVDADQSLFMFYSIVESMTPPDRRKEMAEFITRSNYGMFIGNFEMDFDDGEVRFKTSFTVEDSMPSDETLKRNVYTNVRMMDEYFLGIMGVMYAKLTPEEAVKQIEDK